MGNRRADGGPGGVRHGKRRPLLALGVRRQGVLQPNQPGQLHRRAAAHTGGLRHHHEEDSRSGRQLHPGAAILGRAAYQGEGAADHHARHWPRRDQRLRGALRQRVFRLHGYHCHEPAGRLHAGFLRAAGRLDGHGIYRHKDGDLDHFHPCVGGHGQQDLHADGHGQG